MSHEFRAAEEQCPYHSCIPSWGNSSFLQLSWLPGKTCQRPLGVKGPGLEGAEPSGTNSRKKGRGILSFGRQLENEVGNQKEREEGPGETGGWTKEGKVANQRPGNSARQRLANISSPGEVPHAHFYVLVSLGYPATSSHVSESALCTGFVLGAALGNSGLSWWLRR